MRLIAALFLMSCALPAVANPLLPRPDGLEPAVQFWERIYAEVDTNGGLIHDNVQMDVVYEHIRHPEGLSRKARDKREDARKKVIREALKRLATGKRTGLSADEAQVLARWPRGVSNETLRRAAKNVRFQLGQADKFRAGVKRSGRWRAYIDQNMSNHGVPVELGALPHVESSFNPKAYSHVGAAGMWQFTRSTGRLFMRIDSVVDERLDPWIATRSAAKLLKKNHEITHSWPLAITAYNHGAAGMRRAAKKLGTKDIATIVRKYKSRTFGFASRNFYASFLAASAVDRNIEKYFGRIEYERPVEYTIVEMPHFYRASSLATAFGVDSDRLREHNLALRPDVWNGNKYVPKGYSLRIPTRDVQDDPSIVIANIPASERLSSQHRDRYHKVRRGETLSKIAKRYGTRESTLVRLNNLRSRHRIRVGQIIVLPGNGSQPTNVARKDPPKDGYYTVRKGDNLSVIGRRFGVSESALARENNLRSRNRIQVGQRLRIPGAGSVQLASRKPTPAPDEKPAAAKPPAAAVPAAKVREPEPVPVANVREPEPVPVESVSELVPPKATTPPPPSPSANAPKPEAPAAESPKRDVPLASPQSPPAKRAAAAAKSRTSDTPVPDPSDYAVHGGKVTVQAAETLGHYAEWLEVRASQLRSKNRMPYGRALRIGRPIRLDFSRVTEEEFERRRLEYHRTLQSEYFNAFVVTGTETHVLEPGDTLWVLAERKYRVPVWLLRQYNPEIDFGALPAGASIQVPLVELRSAEG